MSFISTVVFEVIFYVTSAKDGFLLHFLKGYYQKCVRRGLTCGYLKL